MREIFTGEKGKRVEEPGGETVTEVAVPKGGGVNTKHKSFVPKTQEKEGLGFVRWFKGPNTRGGVGA